MDELLARATHGVDPDAPGAFWQIFFNLLNMLPWAAMFWWSLLFVAVGALLGSWRGRLFEGIVWAWVLGPIGWIVLLLRPRREPPHRPPPLPR
ncbi:hypothetical protein RHOFW104T7_15035 [Rhodanobacter thiooxydans]|uniref:Uncharacterized protein n=1 Tax=Rhodanobacter thiooxydans TaxID=416169 RepID=A0A154QG39_9GAMM|nr:hypothetical protein [Rhodanobacter thiooxydans]EIM02043.1 hypothetical protein UUA_03323 [Rhodanobacter thiooxydans LCS2]KZC23184.1 hypothetical protein RHOFW104T7_15035 [Rhodanobacter thiooxydans]MCW0201979.1 hypothetical protein [Rhodanobacter thiooxydans]